MLGRIVEIAEDQRHLSVRHGHLLVHESTGQQRELGRIPLDDIAALITQAHGITYSNSVLVALAQRNAPFVLCGANHHPVGMLLPLDGNGLQAKRIEAQIAAKQPMHKQLWASIVKAKIAAQAATLEAVAAPALPLRAMLPKVKSGDSGQMEAQAARYYWGQLFGSAFRRDRNASGINSLLNYGYTVARSATARAVVAAGLHPSIGLHHSNDGNPMRLVDDLIEPFRPLVDYQCWHIWKSLLAQGQTLDELHAEHKRQMVYLLMHDLSTSSGTTPIMVCMQRLATSLAQVYTGERQHLDLPNTSLPLELQQLPAL